MGLWARQKQEAKHPQLWEGRQLALAPFMGPTGDSLLDRSGNFLHGALTNMDAATDWVRSGEGHALDFDGSNDYVDCGAATPLNLTRFTIAAWLRSAGSSGEPSIVGKGSYSGSGYHLVHSAGGGNVNGIYLHVQGNFCLSTSTLNDSQWHHVVGTYDGATMRIYWDGKLENSTSVSTTPNASGTNFEIGRRPGSSGYYTGQVGDVAIYNRVLTDPEIRLSSRRRGIAYEARESFVIRSPSITGTASITQAANTLSASGSVLIAGEATIAQAGQAVDAAGAVAIAGNASVSQDANSLSASGAVAIAGAAAISQDANAIEGAGDVSISGSVSLSQDDQAVDGSGAVAVAGSAEINQAASTVTAVGAVAISGSADLTQDDQTLSATGGGITGAASITQDDQQVSASGTVAISGAASLEQDSQQVEASGAVAIVGTASITQAANTLTASESAGGARSPFKSRIFASRIFGGSRG